MAKTPKSIKAKKKRRCPLRGAFEDTAARIVQVASRLFARQGYDRTSTKSICDGAGVNIAAIHYHFGSKENLYRRIVHEFVEFSHESQLRILKVAKTQEEFRLRLEMFLRESLEGMAKNPDLTGMIFRDMEMLSHLCADFFEETFLKVFKAFIHFVGEGQKSGFVRRDVEAVIVADAILAPLVSVVRSQLLPKKILIYDISQPELRERWIAQVLKIYCDGVMENAHE